MKYASGYRRGRRAEHEVVSAARRLGYVAERIALSGAAGEKGDVCISGRRYEVKSRRNPPSLGQVAAWVRKAAEQGLDGVIVVSLRKMYLVRCKESSAPPAKSWREVVSRRASSFQIDGVCYEACEFKHAEIGGRV